VVDRFLAFYTGAPLADAPGLADFVAIPRPADIPALKSLRLGSDFGPEAGCTLLIEAEDLISGEGFSISGPGILGRKKFEAKGVPHAFWAQRWELQDIYPRGIDVIFTAGNVISALPRTTQLEF
jgi:alpha-D-ribose 1-methylphosphonate 5-triphosphate synthase subunit PhnH